MRGVILCTLFLVAARLVNGQGGANFVALGKNLANSGGIFAMQNNPANADPEKWNAGIWANQRFSGTRINNIGFAASTAWRNTCFGMSGMHRGTGYFSANNLEASLSQKFSASFSAAFSLGVTNVFQGADYGARNMISGKLAMTSKITKTLDASCVLVNPWVSVDADPVALPEIHISLSYALQPDTKIWAQFRDRLDSRSVYGLAFEHRMKNISLFGSLQTGLEPLSAGLQFKQKNLKLAISSAYHLYLGFSPSVSFMWSSQ